jgi:esterase/lipase superfamily enzyme
MHAEHHRWYSSRLERELGIVVYGHYGPPLLTFPTSGGDEWELQNRGMIAALGDFIEAGRLKVFSAGSTSGDAFYNAGAHPFHRSWKQRQFVEYVRHEVIPFIHTHCRTPGLGVAVMGASLGAYQAANLQFKFPDVVKRCYALSGVYDMRRFMDGQYDDNFYFNNPVDYLENLTDSWYFEHYATTDIHLVTGRGPWEESSHSYRLSDLLERRGIRHHLDDWGEMGGHDWPFWKEQMRYYVGTFG